MSGYIYIVEKASHVSVLLKRKADDIVWVALEPEAMWELEKRNISYKIPEDFLDSRDLGDVCYEYRDRLEEFCNRVDHVLEKQHPNFKNRGIKPFFFNMIPLTIVMDALVGRITQINALMRVYPAHVLVVFQKKTSCPGVYEITFSNDNTLWADLLSLEGWKSKVELLRDTTEKIESPLFLKRCANTCLGFLKNFIKKSFYLNNLIIQRKLGRNGPTGKEYNKVLLSHESLYDWRGVLPLFADHDIKIMFINNRLFGRRFTSLNDVNTENIDRIVNKENIQNLFSVYDICFYPLVQMRLAWIFNNVFHQTKIILDKLEKIVRKYKIKAIISTNTPDFTGHMVEQAARYHRVPVIRWQHGFMIEQNGRISQLNEFNNMMTSDIVFTYGEGAALAHRLHNNKFNTRIISVGSTSLDKIVSHSRNRDKIFNKKVLYVTTDYYRNLWYSGFYPPFSDRLFYRDQLLIKNMLQRLVVSGGAEITIKLASDTSFDLPFVEIKEINLVRNKPLFVDLLYKNHVIVVDSPTTTLLQAVATKKPVFVLMSHIPYPEKGRKLLEKRAVCMDRVEDLEKHIENYLFRKTYPADVNNDQFLKAYGTHKNDGLSAERAFNKIIEIVDS